MNIIPFMIIISFIFFKNSFFLPPHSMEKPHTMAKILVWRTIFHTMSITCIINIYYSNLGSKYLVVITSVHFWCKYSISKALLPCQSLQSKFLLYPFSKSLSLNLKEMGKNAFVIFYLTWIFHNSQNWVFLHASYMCT